MNRAELMTPTGLLSLLLTLRCVRLSAVLVPMRSLSVTELSRLTRSENRSNALGLAIDSCEK